MPITGVNNDNNTPTKIKLRYRVRLEINKTSTKMPSTHVENLNQAINSVSKIFQYTACANRSPASNSSMLFTYSLDVYLFIYLSIYLKHQCYTLLGYK